MCRVSHPPSSDAETSVAGDNGMALAPGRLQRPRRCSAVRNGTSPTRVSQALSAPISRCLVLFLPLVAIASDLLAHLCLHEESGQQHENRRLLSGLRQPLRTISQAGARARRLR
jgi:hypothetical protein